MSKRCHSITAASSIGLSLMIFLTVGIIFKYLFFEPPYLTYTNLPFPTLVREIRAGEVMPLQVIRCNNDDQTHNYVIAHSLENLDTHAYTLLPMVQLNISPGCHPGTSTINRVPPDTPTGRYRVFGTAEIRGLLKTHIVEWYSQEFAVLPKVITQTVVIVQGKPGPPGKPGKPGVTGNTGATGPKGSFWGGK